MRSLHQAGEAVETYSPVFIVEGIRTDVRRSLVGQIDLEAQLA